MMLAPAIAARTQRLALSLILILPFYDPVRLAEDMAVLDIISNGRASYILALGYRPEEFEHFGLAVGDRGRLCDEKLALLRRLLAGETVVQDGRRITVTPRPLTAGGPGLMWGGGTLAAARRAGRYGLGMLGNANEPGMREAYEAACAKHGHTPGGDVLSRSRHPVGHSSSPTTSTRLGRRSASTCCTTCRPTRPGTPATRPRPVSPTCSNVDELRETADVARDYLGLRGGLADSGRQGVEPLAAVRRVAAVSRLAVSQARGRGRATRGSVEGGVTMTTTEAYYDPFDFDIDDDPYPDLEEAARRSPAVSQRQVQLLCAEPV